MFAGDNFKPAADANYRNFDAGPNFSVGSNVRKNNEIGTINSWGPLFRISLDLMIHSYVEGKWLNVLTFKGFKGNGIPKINEERIFDILLMKPTETTNGFLVFDDRYTNITFNDRYFEISLKTWYNIIIEQKNRKVRL